MKMYKKITSLLCLLLIGVMFAFTGLTSASAAPQSGVISNEGKLPDIIGSYQFAKLKLGNNVVYCYDGSTSSWPNPGVSYTLSGQASAGIKYILENGYPAKNIIGNADADRFITQAAIWWFRAEMEGGPSLTTEFVETGPEAITGIRDKIKALVNGAKSARDSSSEVTLNVNAGNSNMSLSSDKKYYVSSEIAPTLSGAATYTVEVSGLTGVIATDVNGQAKSTYNAGDKFLIKIPVESLKQTSDINVKVSATGSNKAYIYSPSGNEQKIVGLFPGETVTKNLTLKATVKQKEQVCVDYVIVGNVKPDPAKTDPTPGKACFDKGTKYNQEKELTTRQTNCKFNGWYTKSDLTGKWVNGTALNNDMTLYGAWDCGTTVKVPPTAANTPLIILGVGLVSIVAGAGLYYYRDKKIKSNK